MSLCECPFLEIKSLKKAFVEIFFLGHPFLNFPLLIIQNIINPKIKFYNIF